MLIKFKVKNFKSFQDEIVLDLTKAKEYDFNQECIDNGVISKGLIYGANASGKTNLGLAIMDITRHLSGSPVNDSYYDNFINLKSDYNQAEFSYTFEFDGSTVEYNYTKNEDGVINSECLKIDGELLVKFERNYPESSFINNSLGLFLSNIDIAFMKSLVCFVYNKTRMYKNDRHIFLIHKFIDFVNLMSYFSTSDINYYVADSDKTNEDIFSLIVKNNLIKDFQGFLKDVEYNLDMVEMSDGGNRTLGAKFGNRVIPFLEVASSGTVALVAFCYFFKKLMLTKNPSFVFVDQFDSFYHYNLSKRIMEQIKKLEGQIFLTSYSTGLMNNDLMRPDCYFIMNDNRVDSLPYVTNKDLRKAHNLDKLYKAGAFD